LIWPVVNTGVCVSTQRSTFTAEWPTMRET
jgi:hypothetical protein